MEVTVSIQIRKAVKMMSADLTSFVVFPEEVAVSHKSGITVGSAQARFCCVKVRGKLCAPLVGYDEMKRYPVDAIVFVKPPWSQISLVPLACFIRHSWQAEES
jgi:hypothetical protein